MKICLVQSDIIWEDPIANHHRYESLLKENSGKTDIVVLPEMFTTGFSMNARVLAEEMDGPTVNWMRKISADGNFGLIGSLIIREADEYFNRLIFMKPDGTYSSYDKGHLFRMEKEDLSYTKGTERIIDKFRDANFSLQICYDLRFPVWSRNKNNSYDILVYIASWPANRSHVWNSLLIARAIENQCFVIGVNRVGTDGTGINYSGDSVIINPEGKKILSAEQYKESIMNAEISLKELFDYREKFPVWLDADSFSLLND